MRLRLMDGFDERDFEARTGLAVRRSRDARAAAARNCSSGRDREWRLTELGQRFLNDLQALFLPERRGRQQRAHGRKVPAPQVRELTHKFSGGAAAAQTVARGVIHTGGTFDPKYATL